VKAENFPVGTATAGQVMVDGTVYYMLVPVLAGQLISNVLLKLNAAGATLTFAKAGLHLPSTMARLAISTDRTTDWATVAGNSYPKTAPLVTPYRVLADGALFVSLMAKGATLPQLVRGANFGQAAMPFSGQLAPFAAQVDQTDLPDPGSIPNPSANLPINFWVGVS
jgi:hypothetical protein